MLRSISRASWGCTLIISILVLPYFLNLGTSSVWDANEAFYAETPREMLETGDYVAPRFNYQPRAQKPPLTYWLILLSYRAFGVSEFALRLPGALAALGVLLFTYGIGRILFSSGAALLGVAILATTWRFFVVSRRLPIDGLLLLSLTATAFFILRAVSRERISRADWVPIYLSAALGFLAKGPVAILFPFGSYIVWSVVARRFSLRTMYAGTGAVIFGLVVLPWYVLIFLSHGWSYISDFFLRDNLGRFATESFGPARGPLYFVFTYLVDFFPWSLLSLLIGVHSWAQRAKLREERGGLAVLPWIWCAGIFLFFSVSKNKQEYYILPIYPMMSAIIAGTLHSWLQPGALEDMKTWIRRLSGSLSAIGLLLLLLGTYLPVVIAATVPALPKWMWVAPTAVLLPATAAIFWYGFRASPRRCFASLLVPMHLLLFLTSLVYLPHIEAYRPVKDLCRMINSISRPSDEVGYFRATLPSMVFYLRRQVFEEFDADAMVARFHSPKRVLCLLTEQDYEYLVGDRDLVLYVLDRRPRLITQLRALFDEESLAAQELLLVSNRPFTDPRTGEAP